MATVTSPQTYIIGGDFLRRSPLLSWPRLMISQTKIEWIYVAAEPEAVCSGPVKLGWSGRLDPYPRIREHARATPLIELVIAFQMPHWIGWLAEQHLHRRLWRHRSRSRGNLEWYDLSVERCIREIEDTLQVFWTCPAFAAHLSASFQIQRGPGWQRLLRAASVTQFVTQGAGSCLARTGERSTSH